MCWSRLAGIADGQCPVDLGLGNIKHIFSPRNRKSLYRLPVQAYFSRLFGFNLSFSVGRAGIFQPRPSETASRRRECSPSGMHGRAQARARARCCGSRRPRRIPALRVKQWSAHRVSALPHLLCRHKGISLSRHSVHAVFVFLVADHAHDNMQTAHFQKGHAPHRTARRCLRRCRTVESSTEARPPRAPAFRRCARVPDPHGGLTGYPSRAARIQSAERRRGVLKADAGRA